MRFDNDGRGFAVERGTEACGGRRKIAEAETVATGIAMGCRAGGCGVVLMGRVCDTTEAKRQYEADEQCSRPGTQRSDLMEEVHVHGRGKCLQAYESSRLL